MMRGLAAVGLLTAFVFGNTQEYSSPRDWIATPAPTSIGYRPPIQFKPDVVDPFMADAELNRLFEEELKPRESESVKDYDVLIAEENRVFSFGGVSPNR